MNLESILDEIIQLLKKIGRITTDAGWTYEKIENLITQLERYKRSPDVVSYHTISLNSSLRYLRITLLIDPEFGEIPYEIWKTDIKIEDAKASKLKLGVVNLKDKTYYLLTNLGVVEIDESEAKMYPIINKIGIPYIGAILYKNGNKLMVIVDKGYVRKAEVTRPLLSWQN